MIRKVTNMDDHSHDRFIQKVKLISMIILGVLGTYYFTCGCLGLYAWKEVFFATLETFFTTLILSVAIIYARAEIFNGFYHCKHCNHLFKPTFKQHFFGIHFFGYRKLRCPRCQKKDWCKKIWDDNAKEEDFTKGE